MNDTVSYDTTEFVWRRLEEPLRLFGNEVPWWAWLMVLGGILTVGLFYIIWMYVRDSRSIGVGWALFLGLLRTGVYAILALVFLMPARQTWRETSSSSKVVLLFDASLSMSKSIDDMPTAGKTFNDMPTRQAKFAKQLMAGRPEAGDTVFVRGEGEQQRRATVVKAAAPGDKTLSVTFESAKDSKSSGPLPSDAESWIRLASVAAAVVLLGLLGWLVFRGDPLRRAAGQVTAAFLVCGAGFAVVMAVMGRLPWDDAERVADDGKESTTAKAPTGKAESVDLDKVYFPGAFLDKLEKKNPITAYRFARGVDGDSLAFQWMPGSVSRSGDDPLRFWSSAANEKNRELKLKKEKLLPGQLVDASLWDSFLFPDADERMYLERGLSKPRLEELREQLARNSEKTKARFFEASTIGESLIEVVKQERGNKVEGIVVFTDGRLNQGSMAAVRDAQAQAADANIPIFVVAVGSHQPKISIDIVDISAPTLIRPDDKFRVNVTVNGQDMIPDRDTFEIFLDVARFKPKPNSKELQYLPLELVKLDEKGQVVKDSKVVLPTPNKARKQDGTDMPPPLTLDGKPIPALTLDTSYVKRDANESEEERKKPYRPKFKPGNPPTAQVEFEVDGATLAKAAGVTLEAGEKVGIMPDSDSEIRFTARVPKDKREISAKAVHVSEAADMRVLEKPLRVLLLTSSSGFREYSFLRTLLVREEEKQRAHTCIHIQKIPGSERRVGVVQDVPPERLLADFPTRRTLAKGDAEPLYTLASYDVVVAFDADWSQLTAEQTHLLSEWVFKDGGGFVFIGGHMNTKEVASPLNQPKDGDDPKKPRNAFVPVINMLPVVLEFSERDLATTDIKRRLLFPQANGDMEFMRLDETAPKEKWKESWEKFFDEIQDEDGKIEMADKAGEPERGFFSYYPTLKAKQNATRIATMDSPTANIAGSSEKQPFLAQGPWGEGKVFWLASGEMWRLRNYKDEYHERFWTKLLREAGSKSANAANRRIKPEMSRHGFVNETKTFVARFEDLNGGPLTRRPPRWPQLIVTEPEGAEVVAGRTVLIKEGKDEKDGKFVGKLAEVKEIIKDPAGVRPAVLKLVVFMDAERKVVEPAILDVGKVEIVNAPIPFKPEVGEADSAELDKANDGRFKVEFMPKGQGEYKLKVVYDDAPDNVYQHKFIVKASNPETDNARPDPETLWELASPAKKVITRAEKAQTKDALRKYLQRPEAVKPKEGAVRKPEGEAESDEMKRLYFQADEEGMRLIPECMTQRKEDVRNRGKIEDLWDKGWFDVEVKSETEPDKPPVKKPLLPYVLVGAVGLLSLEWLLRKLLRLA